MVVTVHLAGREITLLIYRPNDAHIFLERLKSSAHVTVMAGELGAWAEKIEGVVAWHIPDQILERLNNLKWIQTTTSGADHLHAYLRNKGRDVMISTVKGMNASTVAEYVMLSILAHKWDIRGIYKKQAQRMWRTQETSFSGHCTGVVVGLGEVGARVATLMKALGMYVVGVSRTGSSSVLVDEIVGSEGLDSALPRADFLILTVPLTAQTRGLIGPEELSMMSSSAYLINVSRGEVVDEQALVHALETKVIAGATLDVTQVEPCPPDSALWHTRNLTLSAHIAGQRSDYSQAAADIWVSNVHRYAVGQLPVPVFTATDSNTVEKI